MASAVAAQPVLALEASIGARYFSYYEYNQGDDWLDRETGLLPLLGVSAEMSLPKRLSLAASWQGAFGQVDYDGQTQLGVPHKTDTNIAENHLQLALGWQPPATSARLSWMVGFYVRERDIKANNGVSGLTEYYSWAESGLGVTQPLTAKFKLELGLLWTMAGELQVNLPNETPHIELPSFRRYRLGLTWTFWQKSQQQLLLRADWRYGDHRASEEVPAAGTLIHEPAASLSELDISLAWVF